MTKFEAIVKELESLPAEKQQQVGHYIHTLKESDRKARTRSLKAVAGALSPDVVNELDQIIAEGCEQVNPDGWRRSD